MKLNTIHLDNLKGRSGRYELRPITTIYGPNGAGKTTALLAVRSALKADMSPLPEGAADVRVELGFDGCTVRRTLAPKHTVSITAGDTTVAGIKACDAWITEHLGSVVDLTDFLRVSTGERQKRLLALSRSLPEGLPAASTDVAGALGEMAMGVLRPGNPASKKPEERPLTVPDAWDARDVGAVCEWIGLALPRLRSAKVLRERDVKSNERAAAELSAVDAAPDGTLSEAKERVGRLQVELGAARGQLMACEALGSSVGEAMARLQEKEAQLVALRARAKAYPATADTSEVDARADALREALADLGVYEAEERNAEYAERAARDAMVQSEHEAAGARKAYERAEAVAASYQSGGACQSCGAALTPESRGGPEALKDYIRALSDVSSAEAALTVATAALRDARQASAHAQSAVALKRQECAPITAQMEALTAEKTQAVAQWSADKATLVAEGKALAAAVADAKRALEGLPMGVDPDLLRAQVEGLEADLADTQKATDAQQRAAARNEERARLRRVMAEYREQVKALGAAVALLEGWRSRIVTGAAESLAIAANAVGALVFPEAVFLAASTEAGTELRLRKPSLDGSGTVDVPVAGWADSELLVFGVACTIALAEAEGWKWRAVLVDEVQRLDRDRFRGFVVAMGRLIEAGRLDNVILAGALSSDHVQNQRIPASVGRMFKAINLGPVTAVKAVAA